jgi:hypothetical protein
MKIVSKIIMNSIQGTFPTMGGGRPGDGNPVAEALKDKPLVFALGVPGRRCCETHTLFGEVMM